jgi:hypothetical protein
VDSLLNWLQMMTLVVVAVAAVSLIAFGYFQSSQQPASEQQSKSDQAVEPDDGRAEFLLALRTASDEIMGDLDARISLTRELLSQADERIATLRELVAAAEQASPTSPRDGGEPQARPVTREITREAAPDSSNRQQRRMRAKQERPSANADRNGAVHESVLALAREGKQAEEIAKSLGIGTGEVMLILGLSRRS